MVLSQREFQARKDRILAIAIEEYVKTITPISSSYIAKMYPVDLSPATIRNILAELEEQELLTHPHTSAGRIPTQKGYRYYVDHLMNEIQLLEEEKQKIKSEYEKESKELESLLETTSKAVSEATHYTSIVSVDGWGNKIFCHGTSFVVGYPEIQDVAKIGNILMALEEKEGLLRIINRDLREKVNILIGHEITNAHINSCSLVISKYASPHGPSGRIAVLGPTRMNYERVVSTIEYVSQLMEEIL